MATAAQREAWRLRKQRQRQDKRDKRGTTGDNKLLSRVAAMPHASDGAAPRLSYGVSEYLQAIVQDQDAPAAARVNAARTLAEMQGQIGRHQAEPERTAPSLSTLSRDQLVQELAQLRTAIGLGIVR